MVKAIGIDAYTYASGYKSHDAAWLAFEDMCNGGECSPCELHDIESYKAKNEKRRFAIVLKG